MNLLEVKSVSKSHKNNFKSVDKFSMEIKPNQVVGLVGESGCGKSTLANMIMKLQSFDEGDIVWCGESFSNFSKEQIKNYRKNVQVVFQNVLTSLNPRMRVLDIVAEPLRNFSLLSKKEIEKKVIEILKKVGLKESDIYKLPKEFSGGQRQRIAIARAIITNPKLIVLDEATSSLDVSIQSQILNLLNELKKEFDTSYLFISHDLGVVRYISDVVYVMYKGSNVEIIKSENLVNRSKHPYTRLLLNSVPLLGQKNIINKKHVCCNASEEGACKFYCKCSEREVFCKSEKVSLRELSDTHKIACHLYKK